MTSTEPREELRAEREPEDDVDAGVELEEHEPDAADTAPRCSCEGGLARF